MSDLENNNGDADVKSETSNDAHTSPEHFSLKQQRKSRLVLLTLIGMVLLPVAASCFVFFTGVGIPTHTVNRGELIVPPIDLAELKLKDQDGVTWDWHSDGPVYKLVQFIDMNEVSVACSDLCEQHLYNARQVDTRLGKNSDQAIRVLVYSGDANSRALHLIREEYPRLIVLSADSEQWKRVLPSGDRADGERLYIVDRRSFLVMYYDERHDGADVLKDVNHLVKKIN